MFPLNGASQFWDGGHGLTAKSTVKSPHGGRREWQRVAPFRHPLLAVQLTSTPSVAREEALRRALAQADAFCVGLVLTHHLHDGFAYVFIIIPGQQPAGDRVHDDLGRGKRCHEVRVVFDPAHAGQAGEFVGDDDLEAALCGVFQQCLESRTLQVPPSSALVFVPADDVVALVLAVRDDLLTLPLGAVLLLVRGHADVGCGLLQVGLAQASATGVEVNEVIGRWRLSRCRKGRPRGSPPRAEHSAVLDWTWM